MASPGIVKTCIKEGKEKVKNVKVDSRVIETALTVISEMDIRFLILFFTGLQDAHKPTQFLSLRLLQVLEIV